MGQIRGLFKNDATGLTEWLFRKVRNHDPMSQRDIQEGGKQMKPAFRNQRGSPILRRDRDRFAYSQVTNQVIYNLGNGKRFLFTVQEVDEDFELQEPLKVPA